MVLPEGYFQNTYTTSNGDLMNKTRYVASQLYDASANSGSSECICSNARANGC